MFCPGYYINLFFFKMMEEAKRGEVNLGNKGLTKLWNLNPDNLGEMSSFDERRSEDKDGTL